MTEPVKHWYTQQPPPIGAVALCGHVKASVLLLEEADICETCVTIKARKPLNDTGIYLSRHEHDWVESGANLWPVGTWHPVFTCMVCGDVICELSIDAKTWERT